MGSGREEDLGNTTYGFLNKQFPLFFTHVFN